MGIIVWNIYLFNLDEDVDKIEAHNVKSNVNVVFSRYYHDGRNIHIDDYINIRYSR